MREKPYDDISVTDISDKADVSRYTFYNHYESKDALLLSVVDETLDQMFQGIDLFKAEQYLQGNSSVLPDILAKNSLFNRGENKAFLKVGLERFSQVLLKDFQTRQLNTLKKVEAIRDEVQDDAGLDVLNVFLAGGILALLTSWLAEDLPYDTATMNKLVTVFIELLINEGLLGGKVEAVLEGV